MKNKVSRIVKLLLLMVPAVCLSIVLSTGTTALAGSIPGKIPPLLMGEPESQMVTEKVVLNKKSVDMVRTSGGRKFNIDKNTLIVDENGTQTLIQYLLIPCQVELIYETNADGSKFAQGIKVLRTHNGATNEISGKPH